HAPRIETLAFLSIVDWKFLRPIVFGETVRVITRVQALEPRARGRRGVVTWHRRIVNQSDEVLQEGTTRTLVKNRDRVEASGETTGDVE
ncbi:MAG: dehydratase, partial [Planctomycetia bacterium]|nr:dehydratase [Planctomycetia bacterium]